MPEKDENYIENEDKAWFRKKSSLDVIAYDLRSYDIESYGDTRYETWYRFFVEDTDHEIEMIKDDIKYAVGKTKERLEGELDDIRKLQSTVALSGEEVFSYLFDSDFESDFRRDYEKHNPPNKGSSTTRLAPYNRGYDGKPVLTDEEEADKQKKGFINAMRSQQNKMKEGLDELDPSDKIRSLKGKQADKYDILQDTDDTIERILAMVDELTPEQFAWFSRAYSQLFKSAFEYSYLEFTDKGVQIVKEIKYTVDKKGQGKIEKVKTEVIGQTYVNTLNDMETALLDIKNQTEATGHPYTQEQLDAYNEHNERKANDREFFNLLSKANKGDKEAQEKLGEFREKAEKERYEKLYKNNQFFKREKM